MLMMACYWIVATPILGQSHRSEAAMHQGSSDHHQQAIQVKCLAQVNNDWAGIKTATLGLLKPTLSVWGTVTSYPSLWKKDGWMDEQQKCFKKISVFFQHSSSPCLVWGKKTLRAVQFVFVYLSTSAWHSSPQRTSLFTPTSYFFLLAPSPPILCLVLFLFPPRQKCIHVIKLLIHRQRIV